MGRIKKTVEVEESFMKKNVRKIILLIFSDKLKIMQKIFLKSLG